MKYFKTDRSKFGEKILIKLKVWTVVEEETELDSNEVVDVDYNLEFTVESFKTITIMDSKSKDENSRSLKGKLRIFQKFRGFKKKRFNYAWFRVLLCR